MKDGRWHCPLCLPGAACDKHRGYEEELGLAEAEAVERERRGDVLWASRRYLWAMEEYGRAEAARDEAARLVNERSE